MEKSEKRTTKPTQKRFLKLVLPWLVFAFLLLFTYARFVEAPYLGFDFSGGSVTEIVGSTPSDSLKLGDHLLQVGGIDMVAFQQDYHMTYIDEVDAGDVIPIVLERDGQVLELDWVVPHLDSSQVLGRILGTWWFSFVFWIAGTMTLFFIRPRDDRWIMLVLFNYLNAIWLSVGSGPSHLHIWMSTFILSAAAWFCMPVYLHLHWVYPKPFSRLPILAWILLYVSAAILTLLEWFGRLPPYSFYYGFAFAVFGSMLMFGIRLIFQKESRKYILVLTFAVGLILLLPAVNVLADIMGFQLSPIEVSGSILAFPALPGAYFLVAYHQQFPTLKRRINRITRIYFSLVMVNIFIVVMLSRIQIHGFALESNLPLTIILTVMEAILASISFIPFLALPALSGESIYLGSGSGQIEIRANRLLAHFLFFLLITFASILMYFWSTRLISFSGSNQILTILAILIFGIITVTWLPTFQHFVDRVLLGIKINPQDLLMHFSSQITTSLEEDKLQSFLVEQVLPSLLIRQSVLLLSDSGGWHPFIVAGIPEAQVPPPEAVPLLQKQPGVLLQPSCDEPGRLDWIRLVIPLEITGRSVGIWLFGKHDPDDFYAQSEIELLKTLASQTAVALTNINQATKLRTLYQSNIDRQEEERKDLARTLHDQVLGQLVVLSLNNYPPDSDEFRNHFAELTNDIRSIITTLRPAMLTYGLWRAIDELVDELSVRVSIGILLLFDIPKSEFRYDPKAEQHLYRIVQQACENALHHAQATWIRISGEFTEKQVTLCVEDDGVGLPFEQHDINSLITQRHFGLAGMYERANLIGADFRIESSPGNGTRILIDWKPVLTS